MLLFENSQSCEPDPLRGKHRRVVPESVRLERFQGLIEIPVQVRQVDLRVDAHHWFEVFGRERVSGATLERRLEVRNPVRGQGETRRLRVAAVAREQIT